MKNPSQNDYDTSVTFESYMIAPCGMNCGTCIAFIRPQKRCPGCRIDDKSKNRSCINCTIKNCDLLKKTDSKFCYDCAKYPCLRLKQFDKRYRTKYRTSFFENLMMIKENGLENFLTFENTRRKCPECGSSISVHRDHCLSCGKPFPTLNNTL